MDWISFSQLCIREKPKPGIRTDVSSILVCPRLGITLHRLLHLTKESISRRRYDVAVELLKRLSKPQYRHDDRWFELVMSVLNAYPGSMEDPALMELLIQNSPRIFRVGRKQIGLECCVVSLKRGDVAHTLQWLQHFVFKRRPSFYLENGDFIDACCCGYLGVMHYVLWKEALASDQTTRMMDMDTMATIVEINEEEEEMVSGQSHANKACEYFDRLVAIPGPWDMFLFKYIEILRHMGRLEEAEEVEQTFGEVNPDHLSILQFRLNDRLLESGILTPQSVTPELIQETEVYTADTMLSSILVNRTTHGTDLKSSAITEVRTYALQAIGTKHKWSYYEVVRFRGFTDVVMHDPANRGVFDLAQYAICPTLRDEALIDRTLTYLSKFIDVDDQKNDEDAWRFLAFVTQSAKVLGFNACSNKECPFLHIDPESKIKDCPWYDRGFCRHGPTCRHRHTRRVMCINYLCGFCPEGPECKFVHPTFDLPGPEQMQQLKKQNIVCHYCNEPGHKITSCPNMTPEQKERTLSERNQLHNMPSGIQFRAGIPGAGGSRQDREARAYRPLDEVTCYKCGERGHYANRCPKGHLAFLSSALQTAT